MERSTFMGCLGEMEFIFKKKNALRIEPMAVTVIVKKNDDD